MASWRSLVVALCLLGAALPAASALADSVEGEAIDFEELARDREKKARRLGITERTEKRLNIALEYLETEDYEEAGWQLNKLSFLRMNPYERALVARLLAQIAFAQGDSDAAIELFAKALEQQVLPPDDENSLRFNIAQIQISQAYWDDAIATLREWFRYERNPNPLGYYLLAIASYNLGKYDDAVKNARRAIELSDEPREGWLQLLVALYAMKEDYVRAQPVLELLVTRFPKKQYWVQLSLIYGATDRFHESLSVMQLAYAQGLLVEDRELQRLARSYLYHEMPYQAATVLERGLADGAIEEDPEVLELLGNSWISAREYARAVPVLQRAAGLSDDGALYVRLAQVLIQRESWPEACAELEKAIEKGGLENEGKAKLLLAIALYHDGKPAAARSWFERAAAHESTRREGNAWIAHIDREAATAGARSASSDSTSRQGVQVSGSASRPPG